MGDMAWAIGPWALNFWVGLAALYPLIRIFRRAGLDPWPAVFVFVPVIGFAIVGSILAFKPWPRIAPRVPPKPQRRPRTTAKAG